MDRGRSLSQALRPLSVNGEGEGDYFYRHNMRCACPLREALGRNINIHAGSLQLNIVPAIGYIVISVYYCRKALESGHVWLLCDDRFVAERSYESHKKSCPVCFGKHSGWQNRAGTVNYGVLARP